MSILATKLCTNKTAGDPGRPWATPTIPDTIPTTPRTSAELSQNTPTHNSVTIMPSMSPTELEDYKEKARVRWSTPKATQTARDYFGSLTHKSPTAKPADLAQTGANQRNSAQPNATQRNPTARLFQTLGPEPQTKDSNQTLSSITMEVAKGLLSTNSKPI